MLSLMANKPAKFHSDSLIIKESNVKNSFFSPSRVDTKQTRTVRVTVLSHNM